jgi:uncharacterized protein (DUF924 family)
MQQTDWATVTPDAVLDFWFPESGHAADTAAHGEFWTWRMRGGADDGIRERFADLTDAAARGRLDHWVATPRGWLALVIVLDQFSRTVWRDTPAAFAQDIKAARLVLDAFGNGAYDALPNAWEKAFCLIAVGHCEGPDHAARMAGLEARAADLLETAPSHLKLNYRIVEDQTRLAREIVAAFGRHPHRNAVLGRPSTAAEQPYLAAGRFPHNRPIPGSRVEVEAMLARREHLLPPEVIAATAGAGV